MVVDTLASMSRAVVWGFFYLFVTFLFYRITGKKSLGVLSLGILSFIVTGLFYVVNVPWAFAIAAIFSISVVLSISLMISLGRYGVLGVISFNYFYWPAWRVPVTFDNSLFYFPASTLSIVITLGIILYAAYISIAGQPVFGGNVLQKIEEQ